MIIQLVTVDGKSKYALYYSGDYIGRNAIGSSLNCSFNSGFYFKPKLEPTVSNTGKTHLDIDESGERRLIWNVVGYTI